MDADPPSPDNPIRRAAATSPRARRESRNGRSVTDGEWQRWSRAIEIKRRRTQGIDIARVFGSRDNLSRATYADFRIEGLEVEEGQVCAALAVGIERRVFRPRQAQRFRNYAAIHHHIAKMLRAGQELEAGAVVRWYTSISCGLCPGELADSAQQRLGEMLHWINAPEFRLQSATHQIVHLHVQLMADPLVPSFNGILARLLLRFHLGRCGFPPVIFDPATSFLLLRQERTFLPLLMQSIEQSYTMALSHGEGASSNRR